MDFGLPGGWHITIFHPWGWLALGLCAVLIAGYIVKLVVVSARS